MTELNRNAFRYIEDLLFLYPRIDNQIKEIEEGLLHPWLQPDENIGGGKAQYKINQQVAYSALDISTNKKINFLKFAKKQIEECFEESDGITQQIIMGMYFKSHKNLDGMEIVVHISRSQISRKRKKFITQLANRIGLV